MKRHHKPKTEQYHKSPFWIENLAPYTVAVNLDANSSTQSLKILYSSNGTSWNNWGTSYNNTISIGIPAHTRYYFKAADNYGIFSTSTSDYRHFSITNTAKYGDAGPVRIGGSLISLMYSNWEYQTECIHDYGFYSLFMDTSHIIDAAELVLPKPIGKYVFKQMFQFCYGLITAPPLPNIDKNCGTHCCEHMFNNTRGVHFIDARNVTDTSNNKFNYFILHGQNYGTIMAQTITIGNDILSSSNLIKWAIYDVPKSQVKQYMFIQSQTNSPVSNSSFMAFSNWPAFAWQVDYQLLNLTRTSNTSTGILGDVWFNSGTGVNKEILELSTTSSSNLFDIFCAPNSTVTGSPYGYVAANYRNHGYDLYWHRYTHANKSIGNSVYDWWFLNYSRIISNYPKTPVRSGRWTSASVAAGTTTASSSGPMLFRDPTAASSIRSAPIRISHIEIDGDSAISAVTGASVPYALSSAEDDSNNVFPQQWLPFEISGQVGMLNVCGTGLTGNTALAGLLNNFMTPTNPSGSCTLMLDTQITR